MFVPIILLLSLMDTEVVRTFLEIVSSGNFIRAAERLNVGQTTVSARIHLLEEQLGRPLFVRNKAGATLTPEGEQFLRYAPSFVQLWERARQKVAVPSGHRAMLAFGGELSLWDPWLLKWMLWMRRSGFVVDGHARVALAISRHELTVPVLYVDLLPEEEALVIATLDPIGAMATADDAKLRASWRISRWTTWA